MGDLRTSFVPNLPFVREEACQVMHLSKGEGLGMKPDLAIHLKDLNLSSSMEALYVC